MRVRCEIIPELFGGGEIAGRRRFADDLEAFGDVFELGKSFFVGDNRDAFEIVLCEFECSLGNGRCSEGFRDRGDGGEFDDVSGGESLGHRVGAVGFYAEYSR